MIKVFLVISLCVVSCVTSAAPRSDLWSMWAENDPESTQVVSHQSWQLFLNRYLNDETGNGINLFAYSEVTDVDRRLLQMYLKELAAQDPRRLNRTEQKAYWINLYNALTVDLVLSRYPVASIREIRFFTSPFGPWDKSLIKIAGKRITLNDIEHRILRPIWQDPRIHFAVNCASIGCPNLQKLVYTATNIESLLDKGAVEFVNHDRGLRMDEDTLTLSSIFNWYAVDFGNSDAAIITYLSDHLINDRKGMLNSYSAVVYEYEWALNNDM